MPGEKTAAYNYYTRQLIFLWKSDYLGCVVLLCLVVCLTLLASFCLNLSLYMYMCCFALFVCLTLLASFFLPSHLSFKNMYIERARAYAFHILFL